jgi:protein-disulfide isomerase
MCSPMTPRSAMRLPLLALTLAALATASPLAGCDDERSDRQPVPAGDSPARGASEAWVTIIEFSDFQCPWCASVQPTLEKVLATWGDDVRVVYKHLPLPSHDRAVPAALAAECAREQGRFWEMHDLLYERQPAFSDAQLREYAVELGLDAGRFDACMDEEAPRRRIEADAKLAERFGVEGTPGFFVNGRLVEGALPFEDFRLVIEEALREARESGIPREHYYERAVLGEPQP